MKFLEAQKIHFIAIGGIGVSALAKLAHENGASITGSDISLSEITEDLALTYNMTITQGSNPKNINSQIDLVVYSPAVPKNDPELIAAEKLGIKTMSYPEVLGEISQTKYTIAISGTNGKTTTTTMLVETLKYLDVDPTVIVGGILHKYKSNFIAGNSSYFITEACEYKRSFLNIHHDIAIITNISPDHLDYFSDIHDIQSAFIEFINNKKQSGTIICNTQQKNIQPIVKYAKKNGLRVINYGKYLKDNFQINLLGEHNRQNMAAALACLEALNLDVQKGSYYLEHYFSGVKRRMEYIGTTKTGAKIYDDYAHNPEGIQFLIESFRNKYPAKKIIIIFEPHLYSRTEDFKEAFGQTLSLADEIYLFPVYRAREPKQKEKDFLLKDFIKKSKNNLHLMQQNKDFTEYFEKQNYDKNSIIVTVGAGAIWKEGLKIKKTK